MELSTHIVQIVSMKTAQGASALQEEQLASDPDDAIIKVSFIQLIPFESSLRSHLSIHR